MEIPTLAEFTTIAVAWAGVMPTLAVLAIMALACSTEIPLKA